MSDGWPSSDRPVLPIDGHQAIEYTDGLDTRLPYIRSSYISGYRFFLPKRPTMGQTLDLGRRVELQSMDKYCENISLGLYERHTEAGPRYLVHTYSSLAGAEARVAYLTDALRKVVGLEDADDTPGWLKFSCGGSHLKALQRVFLDACKLETGAPLDPKPMTAHDKKADCEMTVESLGEGRYQIRAAVDQPQAVKRAAAVAKGYVKLCEMELTSEENHEVAFTCGGGHDALMGMLLFRAQNVRASMREEESAASRGVLAAPSQQDR